MIADQIVRAGGGPAAVSAVALARQGVSVAIVGTIGDDADGREVMRIFEREGVDSSGVSVGPNPTAGSVIVASREHHSRAISTRQPPIQNTPNSYAVSLASQAKWIHCDHVGITQLSALDISRGKGPLISFDAGYGVETFDASLVDLFVPTDRQMAMRHPGLSLEEALKKDSSVGQNIVVATRGSQGSAAISNGKYYEAKGFNVEVLSTLGAGDVFHGALVAQMVQGYEISVALLRANAVAAISCRGLDGQSAIPTLSELENYLEKNS